MSRAGKRIASAAALGLLGTLCGWSGGARAQDLPQAGSGPVSIEADQGIEWRRAEQVYIANVNAKATRGTTTVYADRLVAHYREKPGQAQPISTQPPAAKPAVPVPSSPDSGGSTEVYRLEAEGHVRITTPTDSAVGDHGVYDIDQSVLVLTGQHLQMNTQTDQVTARDSLEYWDQRKIAVARGNAVAVRTDRRADADTLTAHIVEDPKTKTSHIERVDAFGNVKLSTPNQFATGSKGVYNFDANLATLVGGVRVTQGHNQMNGEYADVNFNTGNSRMLSAAAAGRPGGSAPVRGLLEPSPGTPPADNAAASPSAQAAPATASPPAKRKAPGRKTRTATP